MEDSGLMDQQSVTCERREREVGWRERMMYMRSHKTSRALSAGAVGALALGAFAVGAFAVGALAVGALAIGRLKVGRGSFASLEIGELTVGRLNVRESLKLPAGAVLPADHAS